MRLMSERIEDVFKQLFQNEKVEPGDYRIYTRSSGLPQRYFVFLVWDGFDDMSVTARAKWIVERLHNLVPDVEFREHISQVVMQSSKEFEGVDELVQRAYADRLC